MDNGVRGPGVILSAMYNCVALGKLLTLSVLSLLMCKVEILKASIS